MRSLKGALIVFIAILALIAKGCAGLNHGNRAEQLTRDPKTISFFLEIDRVTHRFKAVDASTYRVSGFPYLRTNRFLEGMESKLNGPEQQNLWIEWMQKLDLDSRKKEIANLSQTALEEFAERAGEPIDRKAIYELADVYSNLLLAEDRRHPEFISAVKDAVFVPDEYSTVMRTFGLYPLVAMPVSIATYRAHTRYRKWHQIQHIRAGGMPAEPVYYKLLPYHALESLTRENGLKESVFTTEGIMKNSSRIEPYIIVRYYVV